jgi:5,5'-dehydrodivanillate O-demethylase oxygenase subunit
VLTKEENERITRVGPGTPGGALLRRYWQPICIASELTPERPKKRVTIMGETVVVYRDGQGRYGCVAEPCPHRGVSLYYGFVEDDGIRCPYHGWKFDACGRCLEQPFEPAQSTFKDRIRQTAYPLQKMAGLLFAYMGPEPAPLLPRWDVLVREDGIRTLQVRPTLRCNWLQAQENTADTVHTYYLHGHNMATQGLPGGEFYYRPIEDYGWELCEWGVAKWCRYGGEYPELEIRPPLIFPNILRIPAQGRECIHWRVPVDDTTTIMYMMALEPSPNGERVEQPEDPPVEYLPSPIREDGEYNLTNFDAQDRMAWETQGPLYDRSTEHLGTTDRGIIMFRKLLLDQIAVVEQGGDPLALIRDPAKNECIEFYSTPNILVR